MLAMHWCVGKESTAVLARLHDLVRVHVCTVEWCRTCKRVDNRARLSTYNHPGRGNLRCVKKGQHCPMHYVYCYPGLCAAAGALVLPCSVSRPGHVIRTGAAHTDQAEVIFLKFRTQPREATYAQALFKVR